MTLFNDSRYDWRETYFVYFEPSHRPKLPEVRRALRTDAPLLSILDSKTAPDGSLDAITLASYEDHAALEIVYHEGSNVTADARQFARSLKEDANESESLKLQKIAQCQARFDVHHFEQTADTQTFNITKIPELNFSSQPPASGSAFSKALNMNASGKGEFYFDPDSYELCRHDLGGEELDGTVGTDSITTERINPEMLVMVLHILCNISHGIAVDPASGIVME